MSQELSLRAKNCPSKKFNCYLKSFNVESLLMYCESIYTQFHTCTHIFMTVVGSDVFHWPHCSP